MAAETMRLSSHSVELNKKMTSIIETINEMVVDVCQPNNFLDFFFPQYIFNKQSSEIIADNAQEYLFYRPGVARDVLQTTL